MHVDINVVLHFAELRRTADVPDGEPVSAGSETRESAASDDTAADLGDGVGSCAANTACRGKSPLPSALSMGLSFRAPFSDSMLLYVLCVLALCFAHDLLSVFSCP